MPLADQMASLVPRARTPRHPAPSLPSGRRMSRRARPCPVYKMLGPIRVGLEEGAAAA
jgi:hypothetical protein